MWHTWGEKCIQSFGWKTCRDHLEDLGIDGMIKLKCFYRNRLEGHGFIWLSKGASGGLLQTWY